MDHLITVDTPSAKQIPITQKKAFKKAFPISLWQKQAPLRQLVFLLRKLGI